MRVGVCSCVTYYGNPVTQNKSTDVYFNLKMLKTTRYSYDYIFYSALTLEGISGGEGFKFTPPTKVFIGFKLLFLHRLQTSLEKLLFLR